MLLNMAPSVVGRNTMNWIRKTGLWREDDDSMMMGGNPSVHPFECSVCLSWEMRVWTKHSCLLPTCIRIMRAHTRYKK